MAKLLIYRCGIAVFNKDTELERLFNENNCEDKPIDLTLSWDDGFDMKDDDALSLYLEINYTDKQNQSHGLMQIDVEGSENIAAIKTYCELVLARHEQNIKTRHKQEQEHGSISQEFLGRRAFEIACADSEPDYAVNSAGDYIDRRTADAYFGWKECAKWVNAPREYLRRYGFEVAMSDGKFNFDTTPDGDYIDDRTASTYSGWSECASWVNKGD